MQKQISLLAIDLGKNLGWSKCSCSIRPDLHINVIDNGTIDLDKLTYDWMKQNYNETLSRRRVLLNLFEEQMRKLINSSNFDCFATEDVFCNPKHISAYRSLVLYMDIFERLVNNEKSKRIFTITPTQIKKHISDYGHADKSLVSSSVLSNKKIVMKKSQDATTHEFDSVAVAWSFLNEYFPTF